MKQLSFLFKEPESVLGYQAWLQNNSNYFASDDKSLASRMYTAYLVDEVCNRGQPAYWEARALPDKIDEKLLASAMITYELIHLADDETWESFYARVRLFLDAAGMTLDELKSRYDRFSA